MWYEYICTKCENAQDEQHPVAGFKEFEPKCEKCGAKCLYNFNPAGVDFILKDGPSGGWPSKGNRVQQSMTKRSQAAAKRQKERYGHIKTDAIPNINGIERDSWEACRSEAVRELGPEKAKSFDFKVAEEKKKKSIKKA